MAITLKNFKKSPIKLSMEDRIHFSKLLISLKNIFWKILGPTADLKTFTKKSFITNHMTWKPSIRSSFSKIESKNSLLGKLLMDYTSSLAPSTSNIIVRALNISNCSTSAGSNSIQAETWLLPFEVVINTVKHEKTCSFCQKQNACT